MEWALYGCFGVESLHACIYLLARFVSQDTSMSHLKIDMRLTTSLFLIVAFGSAPGAWCLIQRQQVESILTHGSIQV
jgi:hypothetical protein